MRLFGGMLLLFASLVVLDRNYFRNDQLERIRVQMAVARGLPDEAVSRVGSDEAGAGKIVNTPDQSALDHDRQLPADGVPRPLYPPK